MLEELIKYLFIIIILVLCIGAYFISEIKYKKDHICPVCGGHGKYKAYYHNNKKHWYYKDCEYCKKD